MPFIEANGARIYYRFDGQEGALPASAAPGVLVLSNSLGTDGGMWDPQMPDFTKRFRVLRYDTRGHGQSAVTPGPYSIDQLARDVIGLLDGLALKRVNFCGLSMGGMVGIWLGANAPERIDKLVLCNTAALIGPPQLWNARIENVRKGGMEAIAPAVIERWFTPAFRARAPEAVEPVRRMLIATPPEGYSAACAAVRDMDQRDALARIRAPTLVIAGTQDAATPPEDGRFIAEKVKDARYVELNAAHLSNIEARERFTTEVMGFLSDEGGIDMDKRPIEQQPLGAQQHPGDQAPAGSPQTGENVCPECAGSGSRDGKPCENCDGTGRVTEIVGDA